MSFNASAKAHTPWQADMNPDVGKGTDGHDLWEVKEDRIVFYDYSPDFFKELCWTPTTSPSTKDTQNEMGSPTKKPHSR